VTRALFLARTGLTPASLLNGHILLWNVRSSNITTLVGSGGIAYNLSFSPDGKSRRVKGRRPECRTPSGPSAGIVQTDPGATSLTGFDVV
jgi:hypothetical protein